MATPAAAAPDADLWDRWTAHDPDSAATIDHSAWDEFLRTYIEKDAGNAYLISYAAVTDADRRTLSQYIDRLQRVPISAFSRREQIPYWINLYNALTVMVVLDHYPVETIRDIDISPGFFANGPWGKKLATVEGEPVSLDDIEHRILRPITMDPRIHYAVNCASIGCPNLMDRAATAANLDMFLDDGARAYVNDPRGATVRNGRLVVSSIYRWFEDDFDVDGGVISHLRKYAAPELRQALDDIGRISDDAYDWRLNDAALGLSRRN